MRNADSLNDLRLRIKLDSKRAKEDKEADALDDISGLSVDEKPDDFNLR
jgi:twitching motility protein PilU